MDNSYEKEIDLKDLIVYILNRWRLLLVSIVIFAILLGGYKILGKISQMKESNYLDNLQEEYNIAKQEYESNKLLYKKNVKVLTDSIQNEEDYEKNSTLFNINPYKKWVATADVFIKAEENSDLTISLVDPTDTITAVYSSSVRRGRIIDDIAKQKNIEVQYLKELISTSTDLDANMFSISVASADRESAQEILEMLLEYVNSIYTDVENSFDKHNVVIMNQDTGIKVDQELADEQRTRVDNLAAMDKKLKEAKDNLDLLEIPIQPTQLSKAGLVKEGIKYSLIGGILGGFIVVAFYGVIYLISPRLCSEQEFKNRFRIRILGTVVKRRKVRTFSKVDNWIDKLEGKEYPEDELVYRKIAANTANYMKKDNTVLLTGSVEYELLEETKTKLKELLPEINIEVGANMNKTPETLKKLLQVDGIIFVEKCGDSKYNDIQSEIETVYSLDQNVVGCIVL